jgi:hypothetical protein
VSGCIGWGGLWAWVGSGVLWWVGGWVEDVMGNGGRAVGCCLPDCVWGSRCNVAGVCGPIRSMSLPYAYYTSPSPIYFPTPPPSLLFAANDDDDGACLVVLVLVLVQFQLLEFLKHRFEQKHRVSVERVVSGPGIANV